MYLQTCVDLEIAFKSSAWSSLGLRGDPGPDGLAGYGPEGLPGIIGPPGQIGNTQFQTHMLPVPDSL